MNICLLNDSFPPLIDGVANAVVNYAENLKKHNNNPIVVTPKYPDGDTDAKYDFPVLRYPGIDVRDQVGYVAGYPFSPRVISSLKESHVELLHAVSLPPRISMCHGSRQFLPRKNDIRS